MALRHERSGSRRMTHREKVEYLIHDLSRRGIKPRAAAPPIYRLLWKIGVHVPPPLFAPSIPGLVCFLVLFTVS